MFVRYERSIKEFYEAYPVVTILVAINLILWLLINFLRIPFAVELYHWGAGHNYSISQYGEYWRFFTPIFLHAGLMHALFNSFALVLFGPALELMLGKVKFLIGYLVAGIIGNIGTYLIDPMSHTVHIGASGAIYGLFGLYIFMVVFRKSLIDSVNAQIVVTIFLIGLVLTFIRPGINIYAHLFGFIGGFALGPIILNRVRPYGMYHYIRSSDPNDSSIRFNPNRWKKRRLFRRLSKKQIGWTLLIILVLIGIVRRFM